MAGEDFGRYGKVDPKIPICIYWLGTVSQEKYQRCKQTGEQLPSLHSSKFSPDLEQTVKTGVKTMTAAVIDLIGKDNEF